AAPELERALLDDNSFVRESAARALGALRSPEEVVVRALTFALGDPDSFVRFRAAEGLAAVGPAALPAIEPLCDTLAYDEDRYARISAGRALVAVGEPEERIAAELAGVLADGEESVVRQARELLAVHLDRHADALPALFPMVDDERLSDAVREFLVRRTGSDFPNAQAWRAWYDSRGK
ncbi:MAG: HEAT repeat domain-containing protein, partial [Planctomycetes bacterium]|nr:HEAT repeat domain-containing protein [Planctomycetota bacterium]